MPVPVAGSSTGAGDALCPMEIETARLPADTGVKITVMTWLPPGDTLKESGENENSPPGAPTMTMFETTSGCSPGFETVN